MSHEKCFAICENKCLVETYSKKQIDTQFNYISNRIKIDQQQTHNVNQNVETVQWFDINVEKAGYDAIGIAGVQINGSTQALMKGYRLFENADDEPILRVTVANGYDNGNNAYVDNIQYSISYIVRGE